MPAEIEAFWKQKRHIEKATRSVASPKVRPSAGLGLLGISLVEAPKRTEADGQEGKQGACEKRRSKRWQRKQILSLMASLKQQIAANKKIKKVAAEAKAKKIISVT